jgi:hypothetical protein
MMHMSCKAEIVLPGSDCTTRTSVCELLAISEKHLCPKWKSSDGAQGEDEALTIPVHRSTTGSFCSHNLIFFRDSIILKKYGKGA